MLNVEPTLLISVVIPLYNKGKYIHRSIQSVLKQSYSNFELIVVDDGSTDDGADIVSAFQDSRLRLMRQENGGVSAARNRGILEAQGNYIAFLDADDKWDPGFLEAIINLTRDYPQAGIYGTGYRMVYPKGPDVEVTAVEATKQKSSILITDYLYRSIGGSLIHASGVMIPRHVFNELGTFKVGEHHGEDLEMWTRVSLQYPVGYDTRILFSFYQLGMDNKIRFQKLPKYEPNIRILQEFLSNNKDSFAKTKVIRKYIRNRYLKSFLWFTSYSNRAVTLAFIKNNDKEISPFLNMLVKIPFLWPFMTFIAWMHKGARSRLAMKILGGRRLKHKVLQRIQYIKVYDIF